MVKKYISDIISQDEIANWKSGDKILITGQTGCGKSEFVKNTLYQYAKIHGKNILLLSNRNLLKNQNLLEIEDKGDCIQANNYQELELKILNKIALEEIISKHDYIVYDEAHYLFSDSAFNRNTDLLLQPMNQTFGEHIFIFITATPDVLLDYCKHFDHTYTTDYDYSYIKNIYIYNKNSTVESILQSIPYDQKAIYFGSNAYETWELSTRFLDSAFICSESNSLYKKADKATFAQIAEKSMFESRFLFATKVLDNGINIKDSQLTNIIIDMLDPISFEQCLGRKRIVFNSDYVNLYIKNYFTGNINYVINNYKSKIKFVEEYKRLSEQEFKEKYRKTDIDDVIDNDYKINMAKYQNYLSQLRFLEEMVSKGSNGYKLFLEGRKFSNSQDWKNADVEFEKRTIVDILKEKEGRKLFKEDQDIFKAAFFDSVFCPKKTNYRKRGLASINAILEEDNIPFVINTRQETKGENRKKYYWVISSI